MVGSRIGWDGFFEELGSDSYLKQESVQAEGFIHPKKMQGNLRSPEKRGRDRKVSQNLDILFLLIHFPEIMEHLVVTHAVRDDGHFFPEN